MPVTVNSETRQALLAVRRARNQFIHAMGEDLPADLRTRLDNTLGLDLGRGPHFTRETAERTLAVIGAAATDVEVGVDQWLGRHKRR